MKSIKIYLIIIILLFGIKTFAANIVYPPSNNFSTTSSTSFFIGNENPKKNLSINSEAVKIHPSGGFFHPVDLDLGENIFNIENSTESKIYKIFRKSDSSQNLTYKVINYKEPQIYITSSEITPLRATPIAKGLNRLQSIGKNIKLKVIGECNNFYKVQLARDDYAWIAKDKVKKTDLKELEQNEVKSYTQEENSSKFIYTFTLNEKSPYVFTPITIYETDSNLTYFKEKIKDYQLIIYNIKNQPENKLEINIKAQNNPFGYKIFYNDNNELILELKKAPNISKTEPLKGLKIMIDPGHGGYESGAVGCLGNKEKDTNLEIANKLKFYLKKTGATVLMTRTDDKPVSLQERIILTNEHQADIFLSIHNNALPDELAYSNRSGTSTYYYNLQSHNLAEHIQKSLLENLKLKNDKVRQESFAVIRNPQTIAVLIEIGYVIIPEDDAKLTTENFQEQAAKAIIQGLENYLNEFTNE